jgi:hypothetical protein
MMYAKQGNTAKSEAMLLQEKALFPESSVLIDGHKIVAQYFRIAPNNTSYYYHNRLTKVH